MYKLEIDEEEVARYLGVHNGILDGEMKSEIHEVVYDLKKCVDYKIEYRVFDLMKGERIKVLGTSLELEGRAMGDLLQDCDQCILLAVTLGQQVDARIRTLQVTNLSKAVVMDFCASSMIEQLCNQLDAELREKWKKRDLYLTDRFSPGYGDLPLEIQGTFCEVLDTAKRMGLHVTSSGLMVPKKSITGIIGIANKQQKMKIKGCKYCDFYRDCEYRKGGRICD